MLTLYRPFSSLFRDDFDRDWPSWFFNAPLARTAAATFTPAVDVVEEEKAYLVRAEIPGVAPNEIEVNVENDVLTLRGERKHETQDERQGYRRVERSHGSFSRSFVLPPGTNADAIEARAEHGVLTVTIPKVEAPTARKVEVKVGGASLVDKAKKMFSKSEETASA